MKLKSYEAIKKFIGNGKTYSDLYLAVNLTSYWKYYRQGKFYFDDATRMHKVKR